VAGRPRRVRRARTTRKIPSHDVTKTIDRITSKPLFKHSTWGISVRDLSTGKVLLGQSGDKMFVPASTFKTLSGATVLDGYGPDHRFKTPVYRSGTLKKGVAKGDLVLVASGDLSLGLREKPDGTMVYANAPYFDHTYANVAPKRPSWESLSPASTSSPSRSTRLVSARSRATSS